MAASDKIALVGAGGVATSLGVALAQAAAAPVAVWSRTREKALALAERTGALACSEIEEIPQQVDIVIISVADDAIGSVARRVAAHLPAALILHTAGSIPQDILREAGAANYGVLYPMQTFSSSRIVDFTKVTVFVEACNELLAKKADAVARTLGATVVRASSEQRRFLHIAAVFACNFANAAYTMAAQLLKEHNLPFEAMLPLIDETAAKVHRLHPVDAQTGPAARGDHSVMNAHKAMLPEQLKEIYTAMSDYIAAAQQTKKL